MADESSITVLLACANEGDPKAKERLFLLVEEELRKIAANRMREERPDHSLQGTVLVDDVFLRLVGENQDIKWQDRRHFFCVAARAMRRMLVDHERARRTQRRGGQDHHKLPEFPSDLQVEERPFDLIALDEALDRLSQIDPRQAQIVEMHHYGAYTIGEISQILKISKTTVKSDWRMAKAWLFRELERD